ncbi:tRNA (adenosine(37)-N6)-threonylcarbamoyltransferase complex dimerization subunit type 1 TsaB [Paenibacillus crassostreae]|uniref:tRNA threonylcarbamoyladenosine biosynthesis protein TsaB n=1 Tax=Paenibacillus crassostreae TaxID=1763538 RepID=A0A162N764_9BACL|nr:tRNA (adenosine(37)-N6)-threonylcarbamoyltransferase complex dimerization subunit type 1 TsaB [Paenibacillus crassostreae]AOZ92305.1 tRNA (adenosine(37)-N6)-threonylcarbamoyltransferase complex dimerization subunit type 1 TsaB [Paenibacillus crassostreae]OAB71022.1 tRNA threonylcarbamoyladenosine biosynthesis protein TsaB [Paenibacillus crassostreae]
MSKTQKIEPQRILALDTSTTSLTVAVMENGQVLHEMSELGERNHSIRILSIVEEVLKISGTVNSQLKGIAVGIGPGSYTGTRIAVTAAKTLAWAWNIPVVGISSLHSVAYGGYSEAIHVEGRNQLNWIVPLMDARRGQVYTALFSTSDDHIPNRLEPDAIRLMEQWVEGLAKRLETLSDPDKLVSLWFVGDINLHKEVAERLRGYLGDRLHIVPYDLNARFVGLLGEQRLNQGEMDDLHALIPNYTQLTEAEANLLRKP